MSVKWCGSQPSKCDLCSGRLGKVFYDGKTKMGRWALMCHSCFNYYGCGLGVGKAQKYDTKTLEQVAGGATTTKPTKKTSKKKDQLVTDIMDLLGV